MERKEEHTDSLAREAQAISGNVLGITHGSFEHTRNEAEDDQHHEENVDVLSRSDSVVSSHNDADGESSEALVDSNGRPIKYDRKGQRGTKHRGRPHADPSDSEERYNDADLERAIEDEEYEDE